MKRNSSIFAGLLLPLLLSSCLLQFDRSKDADLVPVLIDNEYSLDVPDFMSKATNLSDAASLQFQNIFKETYVIVIGERKDEFINAYSEIGDYDSARTAISNYADIQLQLITSDMDVISRKEFSDLKINGLSAMTTELDGRVEGINFPITYFLSFVEGESKVYMIMGWTLQSKKETHREIFEKMGKTFKLLHPQPLAMHSR